MIVMYPKYFTGRKFTIIKSSHGKYPKLNKKALNATNSLKSFYFLIFSDRNDEISERTL